MNQQKIKFFWNGLKVAGDRKLLKGHWSYQANQPEAFALLSTADQSVERFQKAYGERIRFYFKGYDSRSSAVAESLNGQGSYCNLDDSHGDSHFDVIPGSVLWAVACAMYIQQEEKRIARLERRKAQAGPLAPAVADTIRVVRVNIAEVANRAEGVADEAAQVAFLRQLGAL